MPAEWADADGRIELSLDLGFNQAKPGFQCEGLVRTTDGRAVKGSSRATTTFRSMRHPGRASPSSSREPRTPT
ncbi:hypothetical protein [Tessaracoccus coleopterorum]|uniref:hypothetical protein n=1 Tax=Tessaracoccus coleopterorum TaxID=2714950 RepID=UPI0018D4B3EA|nr:hypothetical protein [Tessaracoccus coleopterorum]